jgi:hypothetical protein
MTRKGFVAVAGLVGILLAGALGVGAWVLDGNATFAAENTGTQLGEQKIYFKAADRLSERELAWTNERTGCAVAFAGRQLTTGRHAECYANEYLAGHLTYLPTRLGYDSLAYADGLTYAELGTAQADVRKQIAEATEAGDAGRVTLLEQQLADLTTVRQRMFEGTMLKGFLLTSYGFAVLGETAAEVAQWFAIGAGVLAVLGLSGLAYAIGTRKRSVLVPTSRPTPA